MLRCILELLGYYLTSHPRVSTTYHQERIFTHGFIQNAPFDIYRYDVRMRACLCYGSKCFASLLPGSPSLKAQSCAHVFSGSSSFP